MVVRFDAPAASGTGLATGFCRRPDPAIAFATGGRRVVFPSHPATFRPSSLSDRNHSRSPDLTVEVGDRTDQQSVTAAPRHFGASPSNRRA
jgi:hypothetical protein